MESFSISLWYKPVDTTRSGGEWSVGLYDCRRAVFGHDNSVWANTITDYSAGCQGEVNALTGDWHHVVAVKQTNNYKIYFNGALQESSDGLANCTDLYRAGDKGNLIIGKYFNGSIDDVLIYNKALDASEITELYDLEPCCK